MDAHSEQRAPAAANQLTFTAKYEERTRHEAKAAGGEPGTQERRAPADDRQRSENLLQLETSTTPRNRALLAATDTEPSTKVNSQDVTQRGLEVAAASHRVEIRKELQATSSEANATQSSLYEGGAADSMLDGNDQGHTPAPMGNLGERGATYSAKELRNADELDVDVTA